MVLFRYKQYTNKGDFLFMKKVFSLIAVVLSAALIIVGCSSKSSNGNSSSNNSGLKIGVVTDEGGAKDKSFNQSNVETVKAWAEKNGEKH